MIIICILWFLLNILIKDIEIPTKLACGEKKDIAQGRIKGVTIRDALQRFTMIAIEDNVLRASCLISITWKNDSNLPDSGIREIITMPVTSSSKVKGDTTLLFWRDGPGQLMCLFVELDSRMGAPEHILQCTQSDRVQIGVPGTCSAVIIGLLSIIDVELGKSR